MPMTDYMEGQIRAHAFRTATWTKPTVIAICACTSAPVDASTGATIPEVTNANAYARVSRAPLDANWTAASSTDGLTDNAAAIVFPTCTTATWGTVTHVALVDSTTYGAGNATYYGTLTVSKVVGVGDVLQFAIGDLDVVFD